MTELMHQNSALIVDLITYKNSLTVLSVKTAFSSVFSFICSLVHQRAMNERLDRVLDAPSAIR